MRLSRMERDALARRDAPILPMPLGAGDPQAQTAAHLRHMVGLLKDRQASSPCAKLVSHLNGLYDRSIPRAVSAATACRKGCAHCCFQPVLVYAPEAFYVAAQLRSRPETMAAVQETAQRVSGKSPETGGGWTRCPLLQDSACSTYEARPLSCHSFASLDVNDCIGTFVLMGENRIRMPQVYNSARDNCRMMLLAALRLCGLPEISYEMNAAVSAILVQENAEKRWLRGEDIFAGLPAVSPPGAQVEARIGQMAAAVAPTL